jgi:hypothetical protein
MMWWGTDQGCPWLGVPQLGNVGIHLGPRQAGHLHLVWHPGPSLSAVLLQMPGNGRLHRTGRMQPAWKHWPWRYRPGRACCGFRPLHLHLSCSSCRHALAPVARASWASGLKAPQDMAAMLNRGTISPAACTADKGSGVVSRNPKMSRRHKAWRLDRSCRRHIHCRHLRHCPWMPG